MRIKEEFGHDRISEVKKYNSKVIIASEGSSSEPRYFEGLNKSVLTENIEIINLYRDYALRDSSHPSFIVAMYQEFLINNDNKVSIKEIKNKINNYNKDNGGSIKIDEIINNINNSYKDNDIIEFAELENFLFTILKKEIYEDFVTNFTKYFDSQNITYSKETDSINMVIDRDKDNFFSEQYRQVSSFCKKNEINLYVSNPNFEFWLLLHFKGIKDIDKEKCFLNPKVTNKKRYLEQVLKEICNYNKRKLDFGKFEPYIKNAIENEKQFCENVDGLENNLGSNVGLLMNKIIKNSTQEGS